jgi:parallel beta-helix repeat protein
MQKMLVFLFIGVLFFSSFSFVILMRSVHAVESILYVDDTNSHGPWDGTFSHPFRHIQEGINAIGENGTVYVLKGIYIENVTIAKSLILIGENKSKTIIDGDTNGIVVDICTDDVNMSGFTIRNGMIGIIVINSSKSRITDNTIRNNSIFGVSVLNSSHDNYFYKNNFLNNTVNAHDAGINFWDNGFPAGGNYWDDYHGRDINNDSIGDTLYNIPGGTNKDRYPLIKPQTIFPIAHFSFTPPSPTTQDSLQFTDRSTDSDGYIVSWYWDFGDNTSSTKQYPTHRYSDDGLYHLVLTVTDDYGATNKTMQQILVANVQPTAAFVYSPMNPTDLQKIIFNDSSVDGDGVVVSWLWDFGDKNTSVLRNVTHQYRDNGTYLITLYSTDDDGATNQTVKQIRVFNVAPLARFSYAPDAPTIQDTIHFADDSSDEDGTIVSWLWDFGDGTTSTIRSPSHNYTTADNYKVSLMIVDNDGASATEKTSIPVYLTGSTNDGNEFNFIYIVYLMFFAIMIGIVVLITKKYGH